jgi:hypothetical protein
MPEPEGGDWGLPKAVRCVVLISSNPHPMVSKGVATGCTPGDNGFPQNRGNARNKELASMVFGWSGGTRRWRARVRSAGQRRNGGFLPYLSCMRTAQGSGTGRDGACLRHPALRVGRRMLRVQYGNSNSPRGWTGPRRGHAVSSTGWKG